MTGAPLRLVIVDDEPLAVERLQIMVSKLAGVELVGTASDGDEALRLVAALTPDVLMCDIAMPGLDGLGVAAALAAVPRAPAVIFVTAFDRYAVAAFDVSAVDYLLKPVALDRLERAIARARDVAAGVDAAARDRSWLREIWVQNRGEMLRLAATEIDWIEAERDYMRLHVGPRSWLIHQTIKELEARLDPARFLRIHRSKMVNRDRVSAMKHLGEGAWSVVLGAGGEHRIGRTYLQEVKAVLQTG